MTGLTDHNLLRYRVLFWVSLAVVLTLQLSAVWKPFLGYFASYQTISGMVAQTFVKEGFTNIFLPQGTYLIKGEPAVVLLFYPLDALLAAWGHRFVGGNIDFWGRLLGILFSTASVPLLYQGVRKLTEDPRDALLTAVVFILFPIRIVTGQCFMNDNLALFFFLWGWLFLISKDGESGVNLVAGSLLCSLSFVLRLHFLFLFPVAILATLQGRGVGRSRAFILSSLLLLSLPLLWAGYVSLEGPRHPSLHTSLMTQLGETRRYQITLDFLERMPRELWGMVMNPLGFVLATLGVFLNSNFKRDRIFYLWVLCGSWMVFAIPQKALDHPFYLLILLPPAAFFGAKVYRWILEQFQPSRGVWMGIFLVHFLISFQYAAGPIYADLPRAPVIKEAAQRIKSISEPEDVLIVSDHSPYSFFYYAGRLGWTFYEPNEGYPVIETEELIRRLEEMMRQKPAKYFVVGDRGRFEGASGFYRHLKDRYRIVFENSNYLIFDLTS